MLEEGVQGWGSKEVGREERRGGNKTHCQWAVCLLLVPKKSELSNPVIIAGIKILLLT